MIAVSRSGHALNDAIGRPMTSVVKRSLGKSAVASAAYQFRSKMTDERTGDTFDYSGKKNELEGAGIVGWEGDLESLFNAAEAAEKRKNSQTARTTILPLPAELSEKVRQAVVEEYATWLNKEYGIAVAYALHKPDGFKQNSDGTISSAGNKNFHAHLIETTRNIETVDGKQVFGKKVRQLSDMTRRDGEPAGKVEFRKRRDVWENTLNKALEKEGIQYRVDFTSYASQVREGRRSPREATEHLGPNNHHKSKRTGEKTGKKKRNENRSRRNDVSKKAISAVLDGALPVEEYEKDPAQEIERDIGTFFKKARHNLKRYKARQDAFAKAKRDAVARRAELEKKKTEKKGKAGEETKAVGGDKEQKRLAAIRRKTNARRKGMER